MHYSQLTAMAQSQRPPQGEVARAAHLLTARSAARGRLLRPLAALRAMLPRTVPSTTKAAGCPTAHDASLRN